MGSSVGALEAQFNFLICKHVQQQGISVAILGLITFVVLVAIAAKKETFQVGIASIFAAIIFGAFASNLSIDDVLAHYPVRLFWTLVAVTLLFSMAEINGTLSLMTKRVVWLCRLNIGLAPIVIFFMTSILSAAGVGNIAATALMAPVGMVLANTLKMNGFLMSLVIVGGANATSLSPFSISGVLLADLIKKAIPGLSSGAIDSLGVALFCFTFLFVAVAHGIGFLICGGFEWYRGRVHQILSTDIAVVSKPLNISQKVCLAAIIAFILAVVLGKIPLVAQVVSERWLVEGAPTMTIALGLVALLMLTGQIKTEEAIAKIPWSTIVLVTGVVTYIAILEESGAVALASELLQMSPKIGDRVPSVALASASLSSISSSSGVVLPLLVPIVAEIGDDTAHKLTLISVVSVSAHLVDCNPLSTLGALCLANAKAVKTAGHEGLFRSLLIWGFLMIPAAILGLSMISPLLTGYFANIR